MFISACQYSVNDRFNGIKYRAKNPSQDKQYGEAELKRTSNYEAYKANTENPVKRLTYWKSVKQDFEKMMVDDISPLQRR
ncbi:hypothetical protein ACFO4N_11235 [Camelliibacillus cellulosilyticus]|uniref:Uncharacterized protein n=1 Tax=Camelliibacillus cellulosilyticus TaxID=2174486 RepID=A0ABV9GPW8_9BACL